MILGIIGYGLQLVVAAIDDGCSDDIARILLSLAIQREHHLAMVGMGVASAIVVADDELARLQFLVRELSLVSPSAREMAHPYIATADRKHGRSEGGEGDGTLLAIGDLGPRLDHIYIIICTIL